MGDRKNDTDWLVARPVAHRGLHDAAGGIIENTPSSVRAAAEAGYAIEVDLQITADGEAMVYHDEALGRLTDGAGALASLTAADLKRVAYKETTDRMMTLGDLCDLVAGRVTLVLEMKTLFDCDPRLPARTAAVLRGYRGHAAVMSFDPAQVEALARIAPKVRRGMVGERLYHPDRRGLSSAQFSPAQTLGFIWRAMQARPQFLAYSVKDLATFLPRTARGLVHLPLLTWTVRTAEDRENAARYADQMIFEGFRP